MCAGATHLGTSTAPECCTDATVGGGGCPPTLLPRCPGRAYVRSASTWLYSLPPVHYISQLGRASAQPYPETSSCLSWDCRPRRLRCPPAPVPPLTRGSAVGGAQPVTPSSSTSLTLGSSPAPAVYPCSSFLPSSSSGYRLSLPLPCLPGMGGIPSPRFS